MKRAVSISIGSSKRDKTVEIELFGEKVSLERIGTDGDLKKAAQMYRDLDGVVDALGVDRWATLNSVQFLVRDVKTTPVVDGTGLKMTVEKQVAQVIDQEVGDIVFGKGGMPKKVMITMAIDRWGTAESFLGAGYECLFADMMFGLGIGIPIYKERTLKLFASLLLPIASRLPFEWVYPIGEAQEKYTPKWGKAYAWATVIAGDCHYVSHYMPDDMKDKIVVTNTTTTSDRERFKKAGVRYLVTTTPVLDGRSFGTNMMEAAIVAAVGRKEPVDYANPGTYFDDMAKYVKELGFKPYLQEL
jgi:hypothetical protein